MEKNISHTLFERSNPSSGSVYSTPDWTEHIKKTLLFTGLLLAFLFKAEGQSEIIQSDFSSGAGNWFLWANDSAQGTFTLTNEQAQVFVTNPGPFLWSIGFSNPGDLNITKRHLYKVQFDAKASAPINTISEILLNQSPWTSYSNQQEFTLTGSMQTYSYAFTMQMNTDPKATLQFTFGGQTPDTITFDNIVVYDMGPDSSFISFPDSLQDRVLNKNLDSCTVYSFAQLSLTAYNQEIFTLKPDINIMNFTQWGSMGLKKTDYNFNIIKQQHYYDIISSGGLTTIIIKNQFPSNAEFLDIATRDANDQLVPWDQVAGLDSGTYRAAMANPHYRKYIVDVAKIQVDGGVDGFFYDEPNLSYTGGPARNWTGNEGFDDYSIADFNRYLMGKYPDYTAQDWKSKFGMADSNIMNKKIPPDDLLNNFNYREYLQAHNWSGSTWGVNTPFEPANPLAPEWGKQIPNRIYNDSTFTSTYLKKYFQEIFDSIRVYAMEKYGKTLFMTGNGIMPDVDYHYIGMYGDNPENYDYIPITANGDLDGSVSLMSIYKDMYHRAKTVSDVPLVFCFDAFSPVTQDYFNLPRSQNEDLWQIYAAEAYAAGCYYGFFLSASIPGTPTAKDLGILNFLAQYAQYYQDNSSFYHNNSYSDNHVTVSLGNISYNLMEQPSLNRHVLHLINHNYNKDILPQGNFQVTVTMDTEPAQVYRVSPDFKGKKALQYTYKDSILTLTIDSLKYYDIIALETSSPSGTVKPVPLQKGLAYAYPQPAQDKISFVYHLNEQSISDVHIYIYNAQGIIMAELSDDPGVKTENHQKELNTEGFAPGVYFYTIKAQTASGKDIGFKTGKFLIVK